MLRIRSHLRFYLILILLNLSQISCLDKLDPNEKALRVPLITDAPGVFKSMTQPKLVTNPPSLGGFHYVFYFFPFQHLVTFDLSEKELSLSEPVIWEKGQKKKGILVTLQSGIPMIIHPKIRYQLMESELITLYYRVGKFPVQFVESRIPMVIQTTILRLDLQDLFQNNINKFLAERLHEATHHYFKPYGILIDKIEVAPVEFYSDVADNVALGQSYQNQQNALILEYRQKKNQYDEAIKKAQQEYELKLSEAKLVLQESIHAAENEKKLKEQQVESIHHQLVQEAQAAKILLPILSNKNAPTMLGLELIKKLEKKPIRFSKTAPPTNK